MFFGCCGVHFWFIFQSSSVVIQSGLQGFLFFLDHLYFVFCMITVLTEENERVLYIFDVIHRARSFRGHDDLNDDDHDDDDDAYDEHE